MLYIAKHHHQRGAPLPHQGLKGEPAALIYTICTQGGKREAPPHPADADKLKKSAYQTTRNSALTMWRPAAGEPEPMATNGKNQGGV